MENNLMLVFKDETGKSVSLTIRNAKAAMDLATISTAMDNVIASNCIFSSTGVPIKSKVKYAYIERTTTDLDVIS